MPNTILGKRSEESGIGGVTLECILPTCRDHPSSQTHILRISGEWGRDTRRRRIILVSTMTRIVQHLGDSIDSANSESLTPVFDRERPILSTADMGTWYTGKAVGPAQRSHISYCVHDSIYEKASAHVLDAHPAVKAWVKNDHLGFEILCVHRGVCAATCPTC